jgi:hypothetical protein
MRLLLGLVLCAAATAAPPRSRFDAAIDEVYTGGLADSVLVRDAYGVGHCLYADSAGLWYSTSETVQGTRPVLVAGGRADSPAVLLAVEDIDGRPTTVLTVLWAVQAENTRAVLSAKRRLDRSFWQWSHLLDVTPAVPR